MAWTIYPFLCLHYLDQRLTDGMLITLAGRDQSARV
jgi:hypothetical protein